MLVSSAGVRDGEDVAGGSAVLREGLPPFAVGSSPGATRGTTGDTSRDTNKVRGGGEDGLPQRRQQRRESRGVLHKTFD